MYAIAREKLLIGARYEGTVEKNSVKRVIRGDTIVEVPTVEEIPKEILVYAEPGDILDVSSWSNPDAYVSRNQIALIHDYDEGRYGSPVNVFDPWENYTGPGKPETESSPETPGDGGDGAGNGEGAEGTHEPEPPSPPGPPSPPVSHAGRHKNQKGR